MRHVDGLGEKVLRAELHRLHGRLDVALAGQEDHRGAFAAQSLQNDQATRIRQMQIEHDDVGTYSAVRLHRLLARALAPHFVADALEVVADRAQDRRIVVDEQQRVSHDVP